MASEVFALDGGVNRVYRVVGGANDWVIRTPVDLQRANEFPVEAWALARAPEVGVPSPTVIGVGTIDGRHYMVVEYLPASDDGLDDEWVWLGRYAAAVAQIPLRDAPDGVFSRFGRELRQAWQAHVDYNLTELGGGDRLLADGVYRRSELGCLRELLAPLRTMSFDFGLAHGDLAPQNLIVRTAAPPALIDWGTAKTGPAPWTDVQQVYLRMLEHEVPRGALDQFATAAGLPINEENTAVLNQMTVLRYLDLVRWASDQRPDLYETYSNYARDGLQRIIGRH